MAQRARAEAKKTAWRKRIKGNLGDLRPSACVGPIAAGEKVVASTRSPVYQFIREHYSDALAVEMEGLGFLEATRRNPTVNALVVRAISDLIDGKNEGDEDRRQQIASRHAAAFAFEILASLGPIGPDDAPKTVHVHNVPHLGNPNFTGRAQTLTNLRTLLDSGFPVALTGLGGVGKTQIAVEYIRQHSQEYDVIWWMRADDADVLATSYSGLAAELHLADYDDAEQADVVHAVRRWLREHDRWLVVFDSASDPQGVRSYLAVATAGHVIITSRNPNWGSVARSLQVDPPSLQEAVTFLAARTHQQDAAAAEIVAELLGRLPLALEQAGAYIGAHGCALADYAQLFREHQLALLGRSGPVIDYEATVSTTWSLSLEAATTTALAGTICKCAAGEGFHA
jgi:NB-ARC domain/Phosphorylase superfamily